MASIQHDPATRDSGRLEERVAFERSWTEAQREARRAAAEADTVAMPRQTGGRAVFERIGRAVASGLDKLFFGSADAHALVTVLAPRPGGMSETPAFVEPIMAGARQAFATLGGDGTPNDDPFVSTLTTKHRRPAGLETTTVMASRAIDAVPDWATRTICAPVPSSIDTTVAIATTCTAIERPDTISVSAAPAPGALAGRLSTRVLLSTALPTLGGILLTPLL